jgi:hypothetical protein
MAAADQPRRPFFRRVEHPPFEPRRSNPTPEGWVSESVGRWEGHETEVVYDPRRYAVMLTSTGQSDTAIDAALKAEGWKRRAVDGDRTLWTRDTLATTARALARFDRPATGIGAEGPGREPTPVDGAELAL